MKNKLDLYLSAIKAAVDSLACKNKFEIAEFAHTRFEDEKLDTRDWDLWIQNYDQQRQIAVQLSTQKAFTPQPTQ
jgi:hypothetical protein